MEYLYKAFEVLNDLYMGGPFESAVNNSLKNTVSIITYIATILVALTAIALPLTQQSLQWMEDKYGSESLVKYLNQKSPISPDSIVPRVLIYMVFALIFYVASKALPAYLQVFILLFVIVYFVYVVIMYARYFSYVFRNLSSSTYIHEKMLGKVKNFSDLTTTEVVVLMDIEGARLKNNLEVNSLSEQAKSLGYSLKNDDSGRLVEHMKCYIAGLYKILYGLPTDSSQKKYTMVANLLSYLSFQLLGDKRYEISLSSLQEIAVWVETQRSDSYKPFLSARFLMELPYTKYVHNVDINELVSYTKQLIRLAKDENDSVIRELYERLCNAYNHKNHDNRSSMCYFFHQRINANLWQSDLTQKLEKLLLGDEKNVTRELIVEALESVEVDVDENVSELVDKFISTLWDVDFSRAVGRLSYSFLFYLQSREDCLLSLRNLINPLKSDIHSFSDGILPNTIDAILTSIVGAQQLESVELWDSPKESIIHSSCVLFVYEIVKCQFKGDKPSFNINLHEYCDLDFLLFVIDRLKVGIKNIVVIGAISKFITSHYLTVEEVLKVSEEFLEDVVQNLKKHKAELEESGPLDNEVVGCLKQVYLDAIESNPLIPIALKNLKLANQSTFTFKATLPRVTFLKNTNTHVDFRSLGSTTLKEHLTRQFNIILHYRGACLVKQFPTTRSNIEVVILTSGIQEYLSENGFAFTDEEIIWADGSKSNYFTVNCRTYNSFYCATSNDILFKFQIGKKHPFEYELLDQGKQLKSKASFFFTANV
ncbi:hypothetical protein [Shewanella sp. MBTL60-007]|uniref:hypothetical protein n=1 Tax=Shewanella sp. MBTL60-007 TaxID=2815911 RepID=UPI001BC59DD8|nr:hypothetical protein [Shewanella sp. MBTL60-007]GIU16675.1 hypothetical protein TUM3792_10630 [Shewanella sp. MBTL60-007]